MRNFTLTILATLLCACTSSPKVVGNKPVNTLQKVTVPKVVHAQNEPLTVLEVVHVQNEPLATLEFIAPWNRHQADQYWLSSAPMFLMPPPAPLAFEVSGCVAATFVINAQGKAQDIDITYSFPKDAFVEATKTALNKQVWQPTAKNSQRLQVKTSTHFLVDLTDEGFKNAVIK